MRKFQVTRDKDKAKATAIAITATGQVADRAQQFGVCPRCFTEEEGGGLDQGGCCSAGCGRFRKEENDGDR